MDFYTLLNVPPTAAAEEITAAYQHTRARHIAQVGDAPTSDETLRQLDEAYQTLGDPRRRALYDQQHGISANVAYPLATTQLSSAAPNTALALHGLETIAAPTTGARSCPHCGKLNPAQATRCQQCGKQVSRPCPQCGTAVGISEMVCPRCQTMVSEYDQRRLAEAYAVNSDEPPKRKDVMVERKEADVRHQVAVQVDANRTHNARIFWFVVLGLCIAGIVFFTLFRQGF